MGDDLDKPSSEGQKQDDTKHKPGTTLKIAIPVPAGKQRLDVCEGSPLSTSPMSAEEANDSGPGARKRLDFGGANGASKTRAHSSSDSGGSEEEELLDGNTFRAATSSCEQKRQRVTTPTKGFLIPGVSASPPRFVSLEQIMKAANGVSNMVLAHEIAVDKDFKLEKVEPTETSLQHQVKEIVHKAFWDALQGQLAEDPPNYQHAMILLTEIKQGLLSLLLPHHIRLKQEISEVLDIELIHQQAEKQALDFQYYAQYIMSVMAKLCAPVRDDKIRELMRLIDVVPLFRGILQTLELMRLDMANFTIQQIRPHIQQHSVEYERAKFKEFLSTQDDGLEYTRLWLRRAVNKLHEPSSHACSALPDNPATGAIHKSLPIVSHSKVLTAAYMELLTWDKELVCPETLLMDHGRFLDLADRIDHMSLVAAVLLVTYSTVGPAITGISEFKEKLKNHTTILLEGLNENSDLVEVMKNVSLQVSQEVNECLTHHGFSVLTAEKEAALQGQIQEIASPQHRIRHLVKTRALEFIEGVMSSQTASPARIPAGLSSMQSELARITGQFLRLISHNRAVFGEYYSDLIAELLQQQSHHNHHDEQSDPDGDARQNGNPEPDPKDEPTNTGNNTNHSPFSNDTYSTNNSHTELSSNLPIVTAASST